MIKPTFTAQEVRDMREETGMGMMECKSILLRRDLNNALKRFRQTRNHDLLCDILETLAGSIHSINNEEE